MANKRNKNRWAIVAYEKGQKLEGGGTILAEGEGLPILKGETIVLRVRGYDKRGKGLQAIELAQVVREDPYR
jgi:hypothetical protein